MLCTRDPPQNKISTQAESEGIEKNIPNNWTWKKKSWGSDIYIRQNRLQNKSHNKRQRRSLHNS